MPLRSRLLAGLLVVCAAGCSDDDVNPYEQFSISRAPSEDAVLFFVSGAWAGQPGAPRELYAVNADGTEVERLTTCAEREAPCDFLQIAPSSNPDRVTAVRGAIGGDPAASALYFMDLGRSVETIVAAARRVQSVDWSRNDDFIIYSNGDVENLWFIRPNGDEERPLTDSAGLRERSGRIAGNAGAVIYEGLTETPGKSLIYFYFGDSDPAVRMTSGGAGTEQLEGTPYIVGSDVSPVFSPSSSFVAFCRLTGTGNGGLGTWDLYYALADEDPELVPVATGGNVYRGSPDWAEGGRIAFVETDMEEGVSRLVTIQADGTSRQVIHSEDAGFRMGAPRWIRRFQ